MRLKTKPRPEQVINDAINAFVGVKMNVQDLQRLPKVQREAVVKGLSKLLAQKHS